MRRALFVGAMLLVSSSAFAQENALAASHFERGLTAMKSGDFATACPAFAESLRLDRRPGTLFTLADCEAQQGKLAAALGHFGDYMEWFDRMPADQKANQRGREQVVPQKQKDLRERVPYVTFKADKALGNVELDKVKLGEASIGVPLPVDPGGHDVVVTSPGHAERKVHFEIAEREKKDVTLAAGDADAASAESGDSSSSSSRTPLLLAAGGVGLVGLGVGTVFGIMTMGHKSTIDEHCVNRSCDPEGLDAADSSSTTGLVSTIGFVAVGVAAAAALAIILWPSKTVSKETASLRLRW